MESTSAQGSAWSAAARSRAELQEEKSRPLWDAMLDAAQVGPGTRLLDVGCGAGGTCLLALARGAEVHGIDSAAGMVAVAQERAPAGRFRVTDAKSLPYDDGSFDVVIAANTVQFVDDPIAVVREMGRVCRANGRIVVGIWGGEGECEYADLLRAVYALLPSPPTVLPPMSLSAPGALAHVMEQVDLHIIGWGVAECPFTYPDDETMWRALGSSGIQQVVSRRVGEERVREAMFGAVIPYRKADGSIRMENRMRYVAATRNMPT